MIPSYFKKSGLLFLILITVGEIPCSTAQIQMNNIWTQNYQHTSSSGYSNEGRFVGNDASGNIYITADITSDLDPAGNVVTTTQHYAGLFKFDAAGNPLNNRLIGTGDHLTNGFDNFSVYGMHVDASGNVYVGYNVLNPNSNFDAAIVKYNSSFIRLWSYTFNPSTIDQGVGLSVSPSGKAFAIVKSNNLGSLQYHVIAADTTVLSNSTALYSFDPVIEYLKSIMVDDTDVYVTGGQLINNVSSIMTAKISYNGTLKWERFYNAGSPTRNDIGNKIVFGSGQAVYVVGTSDRGLPFGNDGVVLNYFKGNGRLGWVSPLDYNNAIERGVDISISDPSKVFAVSTSGGSIVVDRLDALRGFITGRIPFSPEPDEPFTVIDSVTVSGLQASPDNNFYISGTIYAKDLGGQPFAASFFKKYVPITGRAPLTQAFKLDSYINSSGSFQKSQWANSFYTNFSTGKLHYLVTNAETFSNHNNESVQIMEFDLINPFRTSAETSDQHFSFSLRPNPADSFIEIESSKSGSFAITDLSGRMVISLDQDLSTLNENSSRSINLSGLSSGVYFIRFQDNNGIQHHHKFIKN